MLFKVRLRKISGPSAAVSSVLNVKFSWLVHASYLTILLVQDSPTKGQTTQGQTTKGQNDKNIFYLNRNFNQKNPPNFFENIKTLVWFWLP